MGPVKWQRWHAVVAALVLVGILAVVLGKTDGRAPGVAGSPDAGASETAGAPDDLLADLVVPTPNASWSKLQRGIGGAIGILPATLPGMIVAVSDLDPALTAELDGASPMFGAAAGKPTDPAVVLAIKLNDPRHARAVLGERPDGGRVRKLATALSPNGYLLVGPREADLERLGPYVTRTLPARSASAPASAAVLEIPRTALANVIAPALDALWKEGKAFLLAQDERMRAERGRAPDFGDPAAIVATLDAIVGARLAIVSDLEKIRVALDVTDDAAVITATLRPLASARGPSRQWVDGMVLGDLGPVLALPATSALALVTRDGEAERAEQGKALEKAIATSLGPRLKEPAKIHEVVEAVTQARDVPLALAISADEPSGVYLSAPVRDPAAADRAIRGAFDLMKADPFKVLLHVREITTSTEELAGLGKMATVKVARERPLARPPIGAAWLTSDGALSLGLGAEAPVTLKLGARPDRKLVDEPALRRFVTAVAGDASTALVAQPLRLDPKRANLPPAPVGIAVGRKGGEAVVLVDVADALLREASRWQMGF